MSELQGFGGLVYPTRMIRMKIFIMPLFLYEIHVLLALGFDACMNGTCVVQYLQQG